jgi:GLPGLI family protein
MSEGSIVYNIVIQTNNKEPQMADALDGATSTVYLKGGLSRTTMVSALGSESTIHNSQTEKAVILKEYSGQKLMIKLSKENWAAINSKYNDIVFQTTGETATIAGYSCLKATAKLKDGSTILVFYTPDITVSNKEYDQTFKSLPGLAMQYEYTSGNLKFKYTVTKIDFNSLSLSMFEFPKSGYREMTYEESQKKN